MYPLNTFSEETKALQAALIRNGFDVGKSGADGILGQGTVNAIKAARDHYALEPRGAVIDLPLLIALGVREPKKPSPLSDFFTRLVVNAAASQLKRTLPMSFLIGSKTVITGAIMVLVGALSLVAPLIGLGDIPGLNVLTPGEAWTSITGGFGLIFLRQGVAKIGQ